jgi:radical SAM protein with 4Fe4S-binding SPASM domain
LLNLDKQHALLESGIETVIFSLDGTRKATHEKIRPRVKFERVVRNILSILRLRDVGSYSTRFIIRFIKQPLNEAEWPRYQEFWNTRISPASGDLVTFYNMHTWAGGVASKVSLLGDQFDQEIERASCHHAFDNMTILADGSMPLCAEDILDPQYGLGNVIGKDPIEVFNGAAFNELRALHRAGRKNELPSCRECTILYSEAQKNS